MSSTAAHAPALLDRSAYAVLAEALGDSPLTVQTLHVLRTGACKVYLAGKPSQPLGAIVQFDAVPGEPTGYGSDADILWALLQQASGWFCVDVPRECAPRLGELMARHTGRPVRYLDDIYFVMPGPAPSIPHPDVRLLALDDLPLLEAAPPELRSSLWGDARALLTEGIIACGIVDGQVVATGLCAAQSERYGEIGIYTREEYRGQGLATAAAALAARQVQARGLTPLWSAGGHNAASLRVAEKLGYVEVARRQYVISE